MMHWMNWSDWNAGMGSGSFLWMMGLHMLWYGLVIGLAAIVAIFVVKRFADPRSASPLDVLKARYARGELNKDEFDRMRKDLAV